MTQYMLIKACIYIVIPEQKWIVFFIVKTMDKNKDGYSWKWK